MNYLRLTCLLRISVVLLGVLLSVSSMEAQRTENNKKEKIPYLERDSLFRIHSPRKALLLNVFVPGAGQIYNKKYVKAGIAWAGIATSIYFIIDNTNEYNTYKEAFIAISDDDLTTINQTGVADSSLEEVMNTFRKWREISYIALGGVYVLAMLDSYVDGYLYHFDINDKLTAGLNPYFGSSNIDSPFQGGLSLTLRFR